MKLDMDPESTRPTVPPLAYSDATTNARPTERRGVGLRRVPELTAYFWVTKVLTTAMGESTSD